MRHRGGPRPMTHLHRGLWPQWQWAGARSLWLLFWILVWVECDTVMGLMTHVTLVTRLGLSVILMSSVILTNDGCDTPPYTNRNHSHHKPGPNLSNFKPKCQNRLSDVKIFQATFWVENIQVRGNEQARDSVPWIMFSDCNNQKTALDTIASDWGDNEWKHCAFGSLLFLWQLDL